MQQCHLGAMYSASQKMTQRPLLLSTLVFLDLETTGLPSGNFKPEITELCMLAASRFTLEQQKPDTPIRVQNKLTLCFRPTRTIQPAAGTVSGLNLTNLFHQKDFDATAVDLIQQFLKRLDPPVCLLAHNGNRFDFPLLRAELASVRGAQFQLVDCSGSPVICSDTLPLFTALNAELKPFNTSMEEEDSGFISLDAADSIASATNIKSGPDRPIAQSSPKKPDGPTTIANKGTSSSISFRLGDVYARVFGSHHAHAHSAEGDCLAMMQLVQHLGLSAMDWLQTHYANFNQIPLMYTPVAARSTGVSEFPYKQQPRVNTADQNNKRSTLNDTVSQLKNIQLD